MMPDLGKYAGVVLGAYGVSLALILGLVALMLLRGQRVKRKLEEMERRNIG